jgi:hypothetical protein
MCRRPFFCPPVQSDEPRLRVTEYSLDVRAGTETGKRVRVHQSAALSGLGHRAIMPNFRVPQTGKKSYKNRFRMTATTPFLPTQIHEEPVFSSA